MKGQSHITSTEMPNLKEGRAYTALCKKVIQNSVFALRFDVTGHVLEPMSGSMSTFLICPKCIERAMFQVAQGTVNYLYAVIEQSEVRGHEWTD